MQGPSLKHAGTFNKKKVLPGKVVTSIVDGLKAVYFNKVRSGSRELETRCRCMCQTCLLNKQMFPWLFCLYRMASGASAVSISKFFLLQLLQPPDAHIMEFVSTPPPPFEVGGFQTACTPATTCLVAPKV
jgi:hypothetical protein